MDKNNIKDDSWMYILLLTTLLILTESIKNYSFTLLNTGITYASFLLPLSFFLTNFITKKYTYKKTIPSIFISCIVTLIFVAIMCFTVGKDFIFNNVLGEFFSYLVSQLINLAIYEYIIKSTSHSSILIYGIYLFSSIIFYTTYSIVYINSISIDTYWIKYLLTIFIEAVIFIPLSVLDRHIKIRKLVKIKKEGLE